MELSAASQAMVFAPPRPGEQQINLLPAVVKPAAEVPNGKENNLPPFR
jgi:hypothetical protein